MAKSRTPPRPVAFQVMRRLAAIEGLCRYARAAVRLKMGDSNKLARADDDLEAAILGLEELRGEIAASNPLGQDSMALQLAESCKWAAEQYMVAARHDHLRGTDHG